VVNQGRLIGGFVALLGNQVENSGLISTIRGSTALTAADGITLNFDAAGLIAIKVDMAAYDALVHNSGVIEADGGRVVMTAAAANQLLTTVINTDGIVQARTAEQKTARSSLMVATTVSPAWPVRWMRHRVLAPAVRSSQPAAMF